MIELFLALCLNAQEPTVSVQPLQFSVTHDGSVGESIDGRVYVMLTKRKVPPVGGPNWWSPEPFFAIDVKDWKTNEPLLLNDQADSMGELVSALPEGSWKAVGVFRALTERSFITVFGGLYSEAVSFEVGDDGASTVDIALVNKVPQRTWTEHKNLRLVEKTSPMLSEFFDRDIQHGACVIVPDDYDPKREEPYPVMYWIGGYGSDHRGGRMMKAYFTSSDFDDQVCRVVLNAQTYLGHHVFADSENNGPRMTALLEEFIPYLEKEYNLGGSGNNRFLAGHSSGGWAALWLQVQNPDFFNGAWALAPDPLDFHYFQTVDLYEEGANMFVDSEGNERPLGRMGTTPVLFTRGFTAMDDVLKDGGQMASFEAVFSPKGSDGRPAQMFNHETGVVNPEVVEHWKKYDIRQLLENNWDAIAPKLKNKINIIAGGLDTFYLEKPVIELKTFFLEHGFDSNIEVLENGDHGSVFKTTTLRKMDAFIAAKLNLPNNQKEEVGPAVE